MPHTILEADAIVKEFERVRAVDALSFRIDAGDILALLGPNGAGKTTTVRILVGIIRPDSGEIRHGLHRAQTGYLPEERGLYQDTPVLRTLAYFGVLRGMVRQDAVGSARHWLDRLGLTGRAEDAIKTLSKGNQQKVQLIAAILHRPRFAVLDEPFSGLDPVNQEMMLDLIRELRDEGTTILLSAHQMSLVERVASRILLMNEGSEILSGTLDELRLASPAGKKLLLHVAGQDDPVHLQGRADVHAAKRTAAGEITLTVRTGHTLGKLLAFAAEKYEIVDVHSERVPLHEIYVSAVANHAAERAEAVPR